MRGTWAGRGVACARLLAVLVIALLASGCVGRGSAGAAPTPTVRTVTPPPRDRPADAGVMDLPAAPAPTAAAVPASAPSPVSGAGVRTVRGELGPDRAADDVPVAISAGDVLEATLSAPLNLDLLLLDDGGGEVRASRRRSPDVDVVSFAAGGERNLTLHVVAPTSLVAPAPYTLSVAISRQDDAGSGGDVASPHRLQPGNVTGFVGDDDAADDYLVSPIPGGAIAARLLPPAGVDLDLVLLDGAGRVLRSPSLGAGRAEDVTYVAGGAGPYSLRVRCAAGRAAERGAYALALAIEAPDDAGTGRDAGDGPAGALPGRVGTVRGAVGDGDEADCYAFGLHQGSVLIAELIPPVDRDLDLAILDTGGAELAASRGGTGRAEGVRWRAWGDANVSVSVDCRKGCEANRGPYDLTVVVG